MCRGGYRLLQPPGVANLLFQVFSPSHSALPRTLGAGHWDKTGKEVGRHLPHTQKRGWTLIHHSGAEFPEGDSGLERGLRGARPHLRNLERLLCGREGVRECPVAPGRRALELVGQEDTGLSTGLQFDGDPQK